MMSRADLDRIQGQLRVAIQNHQVLVSRMKNDPQNAELKRQLHSLQREITSLSEKQKSIVQQLRKELVSKQVPSNVLQVSQSTPTNLSTTSSGVVNKVQPLNLSVAHNAAVMVKSEVKKPQPINQGKKPGNLTPHHQQQQAKPKGNHKSTANQSIPSPNPALRIPNYQKPSILQGGSHRNSSTSQSQSVNTKVSKPSLPHSGRKPTEVEQSSTPGRFSINSNKELSPDERKKLEFMAALDLITPDTLKDLQTRRSERKRRSTANPQFSYGSCEPEKKRVSGYLAPAQRRVPDGPPRKRGRPPKYPKTPEKTPQVIVMANSQNATSLHGDTAPVMRSDVHEDVCAECHQTGELLMCDTCNLVYHLKCLQPPLTTIPTGLWSCPKCKALGQTEGKSFPDTLPLVHSYITAKNNKQEEKKKLLDKKKDLASEKAKLEMTAQQLKEKVVNRVGQKADLAQASHGARQKIAHLEKIIKGFQST